MIKFSKHYVQKGNIKARVHYSFGSMVSQPTMCVTLYAKSYEDGNNLSLIFAAEYVNDSNPLDDYSEKGRVRIKEGNKLFEVAKSRALINAA